MSDKPSPPTPTAKDSPRPFIPAWLDEAGLSQAEFRLYCHLCRRADNETGIAWPSYESIAASCHMARNTAWRTLKQLAKRGLVRSIGKKFGTSNRYQILTPIVSNEAPLTAPIVSNGERMEDCQSYQMEYSNRIKSDTPIVPDLILEGIPKKVIQGRQSKKRIYSDESIEFANWFKSTLPESMNVKNWQDTFQKAYDDLVRIDKRSPEQIREICQWARNDDYWHDKFFSPARLRRPNKDGINYYDFFSAQMKPATRPTTGGRVNIGQREYGQKPWRAGECASPTKYAHIDTD